MSTGPSHPAHGRALRHVGDRSVGPPLDPRLRVTVNFHPDRPARDGLLVVEALARDGFYRSQFVTGTSNGGLAPTLAATAGSGATSLRRRPTTTRPPKCARSTAR